MWTRERRLAFLVAQLLKVVLALSVIGGVLALLVTLVYVFMTVTGRGETSASVTLPISLTIPENVYGVSAIGKFRLISESAGIVVPLASTPWAVQFLALLVALFVYAFYIYVVYSLQKMFTGFANGRPFQAAGVRAIQLIAWTLIVGYAFVQLNGLLSSWVLAHISIVGDIAVERPPLLGTSNEQDLITGVALLLIARAFSRAAVTEQERDVLQQEQDLIV